MPNDHSDNRTREFVRLLATSDLRLSSYVLALVPNWSDAEEILQETKLRLWEQFDKYDGAKDFGSWACTIAYYQVMTLRTHAAQSRIRFSQEFLDRVSVVESETVPESDARLRLLQRCIDKLNDWQRELLRRCCMAGDSVAKVARELNRKVDSTRKSLLRIRRQLYDCVEEASHDEEQQ